jgi:hypothetical protein
MAPHISSEQKPQASIEGSTYTPPVPLDTVLHLLTSPESEALVLRHIAALEAVARKNSAGFHFSDVELACSIMDVTIRAIKQGKLQFVSALCLMLRCDIHDHVSAALFPSVALEGCCVNAEPWAVHSGKKLSQRKLETKKLSSAC